MVIICLHSYINYLFFFYFLVLTLLLVEKWKSHVGPTIPFLGNHWNSGYRSAKFPNFKLIRAFDLGPSASEAPAMAETICRALRDGGLEGEHAPALTIKDSLVSPFGFDVFTHVLAQLSNYVLAGKSQSRLLHPDTNHFF